MRVADAALRVVDAPLRVFCAQGRVFGAQGRVLLCEERFLVCRVYACLHGAVDPAAGNEDLQQVTDECTDGMGVCDLS